MDQRDVPLPVKANILVDEDEEDRTFAEINRANVEKEENFQQTLRERMAKLVGGLLHQASIPVAA